MGQVEEEDAKRPSTGSRYRLAPDVVTTTKRNPPKTKVRPWTTQGRPSRSGSAESTKPKARPTTATTKAQDSWISQENQVIQKSQIIQKSQVVQGAGESRNTGAGLKGEGLFTFGPSRSRQARPHTSHASGAGGKYSVVKKWSDTELSQEAYSSKKYPEALPPRNDEEEGFTRVSDFSSDDEVSVHDFHEPVDKPKEEEEESEHPDEDGNDLIEDPAAEAEAEAEEQEEEEEEDKDGRLSKRADTLESWLAGPSGQRDEDYDTDLEEDFPPEPEPPVDPTGAYSYAEKCKKQGLVPVSYLVRNLGDGTLRMRHHYLGGIGTKPLAAALKSNTICEEIDLSDNYVEGDGAAALAGMLKDNMFVVNLNISHNFIKTVGASAFAEMLETNTTLKTLSLKGNQLSDWDAKKISEAMKSNMSLVCLDLSNNCFGEKAGLHLANGIASNIGLNDLDLSWNGIREKGAVAVAKAIAKNNSLEIFDISWNGFAHNGTIALAQSIRVNKALRVLDISNNRIDTEAAIKLGQGVARNKGLETLLLGTNPIGEAGVEALIKGIDANKTLKLVGLEGCVDMSICPRLQQRIKEISSQRDIMFVYSSGSPQQSKMNQTIMAVFDRFISENEDRMEDLFNQMDKDKTGMITLEMFKYGLKDFGLRLTSRQMDLLLEELDADRSGTIEFEELMASTNMVEAERQKRERAEKEALMFQEGMVIAPQNNNNEESKGQTGSKQANR